MRPRRANVVNMETDAPRPLRNKGTVLQGIIDTFDAVTLHRQKKTRRALRTRRPGIEKGRRRVGKIFLRHERVGFHYADQIVTVETNRHAHPHMLGALHRLLIHFGQIGTLQCFETEIVNQIVARIVAGGVQFWAMCFYNLEQLVGNKRRRKVVFVTVFVELGHRR